jgi:hypothetical protein
MTRYVFLTYCGLGLLLIYLLIKCMTAVSAAVGGEVVDDRGAESESSTPSSTHPSLGRPYTPDDSSEADAGPTADGDSLRKNSTDSNPSSKDTESVHQLEMPESSVHRALVTASLDWTDSLVVDSLASSIVKANACEQNAVKHPAYDVVCRFLSYCGLGWLLICI